MTERDFHNVRSSRAEFGAGQFKYYSMHSETNERGANKIKRNAQHTNEILCDMRRVVTSTCAVVIHLRIYVGGWVVGRCSIICLCYSKEQHMYTMRCVSHKSPMLHT